MRWRSGPGLRGDSYRRRRRHCFAMLFRDQRCMETANRSLIAGLPAGQSLGGVAWVCVVAGLAGVAGCLFYGHAEGSVGPAPLWLYAGTMYAGLIGASAAAIYWALPKLRHFIELTAVSRLFLALVAFLVPEIAEIMITSPVLNATMVVGGALMLRQLLGLRPKSPVRVWSSVSVVASLRAG